MIFKRKTELPPNDDGQPLNRFIAHSRLVDRNIDELIGLCKGVLCDGAVSLQESKMLLNWLETNRHAADKWPANILYERLKSALKNGVIDDDEEHDLLLMLSDITGRSTANSNVHSGSTTIPLSNPMPEITFAKKVFCITGKFIIGPRAEISAEIEARGGIVKKNPTRSTHYLIIGEVGSRDWIHSTFGRKIEKAVEYRETGSPIAIISEEHFAQQMA